MNKLVARWRWGKPGVGALVVILLSGLATEALGQIENQDPTQFVAGVETNVFVAVRNSGPTGEFAVRCVGVPSGWSVNNGAFPPSDFIYVGPMTNNQVAFPGPFNVQVPAEGGSGQMAWQLWRVTTTLV